LFDFGSIFSIMAKGIAKTNMENQNRDITAIDIPIRKSSQNP
jgi:hypothetical protein